MPICRASARTARPAPAAKADIQASSATVPERPTRWVTATTPAHGSLSSSSAGAPSELPCQSHGAKMCPSQAVPMGGATSPPATAPQGRNHVWTTPTLAAAVTAAAITQGRRPPRMRGQALGKPHASPRPAHTATANAPSAAPLSQAVAVVGRAMRACSASRSSPKTAVARRSVANPCRPDLLVPPARCGLCGPDVLVRALIALSTWPSGLDSAKYPIGTTAGSAHGRRPRRHSGRASERHRNAASSRCRSRSALAAAAGTREICRRPPTTLGAKVPTTAWASRYCHNCIQVGARSSAAPHPSTVFAVHSVTSGWSLTGRRHPPAVLTSPGSPD